MRVDKDIVEFHRGDINFVKKFGIMEATDMVLDFYSCNQHPFIYDTYQLAAFFSVRHSDLFRTLRNINTYYSDILLRKRDGSPRRIQAPYGILKMMQNSVLKRILICFPISKYATAYHVGARIQNNAKPHVGKKFLLKIDLSDFFGSIRFEQVYSTVFNTKYFPRHIGTMLTAICCYRDVLPQGAPTSPAISNLVMRHFDDTIGAWCEKRGISYTRYCDDLTFSGNASLYPVYEKAKSMLEAMGFEINTRKTHYITHAARQSVTGLTVNEKVTVSSAYKRLLRQECHYAIKFGLRSAILYSMRSDFISADGVLTEKYRNHLLGRVRYVLQIEPENLTFIRYLTDLKRL